MSAVVRRGNLLRCCCVVVVLLATLVMLPITDSDSSVEFYVYGTTCPYCRFLDEFMVKVYGGRHYFCKINVDEACSDSLNKIVNLLISKGVPTYI